MNPSGTIRVRLVPDLSASAFRTKQTKELVLWHCLRAINHWGSGILPVDMAISMLQEQFYYSRRTAYRHLALGKGKLWVIIQNHKQKGHIVVQIYGLRQVALYLDTLLMASKRFYDVPGERFGSLKERRLRLWESIFPAKGVKTRPISHAALEEYTGMQKRQQIRYNHDADVRRTVNFGMWRDGRGYRPAKRTVQSKSREMTINERLPNIYHCKQEPGHRGMLKRVRAMVRHTVRSSILGEALANVKPQLYFNSIGEMIRSKNKEEYCWVLIRSTRRQIKGRLEWAGIICI